MTTTQFLKISSSDRDTGTPEDFTIDFPQHLRGKTFKLAYAFIPITWYNVNETNNKFYFEEVPSVTIIATIPTGIYNNTTILNAVKTAMESVSPLIILLYCIRHTIRLKFQHQMDKLGECTTPVINLHTQIISTNSWGLTLII